MARPTTLFSLLECNWFVFILVKIISVDEWPCCERSWCFAISFRIVWRCCNITKLLPVIKLIYFVYSSLMQWVVLYMSGCYCGWVLLTQWMILHFLTNPQAWPRVPIEGVPGDWPIYLLTLADLSQPQYGVAQSGTLLWHVLVHTSHWAFGSLKPLLIQTVNNRDGYSGLKEYGFDTLVCWSLILISNIIALKIGFNTLSKVS